MKYAIKLAWHGSIFLARVVWIGATLAVGFFLLLMNSSSSQDEDYAGSEIPDPFDRMHPNWRFYWDQQKSDLE